MDPVTIIMLITLFLLLYTSIFWVIMWVSKYDLIVSKKTRIRKFPRITILIPAYNEEHHIAETVSSVLKLEYPSKLEIIVLDDGSKDRTYAVAKHFPVKVVKLDHGGKAAALNRGIKMASGDVIVTLDADSMPEKNALTELIPYLNDPEVGAVSSALKVHSPTNILQQFQWIEYISGILQRKMMSILGVLYIIPGPLSAYKKWVFDKIGGFDVGNITEDTEMGLRLLYNNIKVENCPTAVVHTIAPENINGWVAQRMRWYAGFLKNASQYRSLLFNKSHGGIGLYLPLVILSLMAVTTGLGISFYYLDKNVDSALKWIRGFAASGMDLGYIIKLVKIGLTFKLNVYSIDWSVAFFSIVFFGTSLFLMWYAHRFTKEKGLRLTTYMVFVLIYYQLLGLVWIGSVIKWLLKENKW